MPKTPAITHYGLIEYDLKCNLIKFCKYINKLEDVISIRLSYKILKRALAYIFITLTTKTYFTGLTRNHASHFVCF